MGVDATLLAVYYTSEWFIRLGMLGFVSARHRPGSAMSWLLLVFFLPWPGLILYLIFGHNRLPRRRISQHAALVKEVESLVSRYRGHPEIIHPNLGGETRMFVDLAERLGYMPILGGNAARMLTDTDETIDTLIADIEAALSHVHLLYYIYADDATGQRVADALIRAAERGVACRVLVDAVGSRWMLSTLAPRLREHGVQVFAVLPVGLFRRHAARIDLRDHRKLTVIDGQIAYTGSQNIVDADYGYGDLAWRDMTVRLLGPILLELQMLFVAEWYFETEEILNGDDIFPEPKRCGTIPVQVLPSGPSFESENYQRMVVTALHAAQKQVLITSPYFVPDEPLMQALELAVLRGVEVELILPERSDQFLVGTACKAYYDELLAAGVKVYLHHDGLLHAKTITIDDRVALLGSSNFDIRSFALNFEINLLFYGSEITLYLRDRQLEYLQHAKLLEPLVWRQRNLASRVLQNIAKLFSPLL